MKDTQEHTGNAAEFFGTQADRWAGLYMAKAGFIDRLGLFRRSLRDAIPAPARVLDFGCGPGIISLALTQDGYDVHGVDGSSGMIDRARMEAKRRGTTATFEVMDAASAGKLTRGHFDAIVSSSVIEYVEEDGALLLQFVRALRPGGFLLVSVPHTGSLVGWVEDVVRRTSTYTFAQGRRHLVYSLRRYRRATFVDQLRSIGLSPQRIVYFESPVPGGLGVRLSRHPLLGTMMLVASRRE